MSGATLVWFRQDLRLHDNPALHAAAMRGQPVIPVYVWSPEEEGDWPPGAASRWWLHQSLEALNESLRARGSHLVLARGTALDVLRSLAARTRASAVFWSRRYEPAAAVCEARVEAGLRRDGLETARFNSALLSEPGELLNRSGKPYQVYGAFRRALLGTLDPPAPLPIPGRLRAPRQWPRSVALQSFGLLPKIPWTRTLAKNWRPGEAAAHLRLKHFLSGDTLARYRHAREQPGTSGTSSLSPFLHFGEIGPRQVWHALGPRGRASVFLRELLWREFAYHLLHHFPRTPLEPLRPEFRGFAWKRNARYLAAWQQGRTGIPLVDAGMRELWTTGWMHNRVRMVTASLLVKNLLVRWQEGARWFWDTLVDADLANNTLNWQWVAGCGADAAPYFRIFNPHAQAKRYDPEGEYVRRWVPDAATRAPIVDLSASREAALDAYHSMRRACRRAP